MFVELVNCKTLIPTYLPQNRMMIIFVCILYHNDNQRLKRYLKIVCTRVTIF